MKKTTICLFLIALCIPFFTGAAGAQGHDHAGKFAEAKRIIDARVSCDKLTDSQLEALGEYYMEQMHPGEAHERMDRMARYMMGEEGLRRMHINMGVRWYCGDTGGGMMGGMMGYGQGRYGNASQYGYPTGSMGGMMGNRSDEGYGGMGGGMMGGMMGGRAR